LLSYWGIGKELSKNAAYGKSVVEKLSRDLKLKYPDTRGYSVRNLWNMKRFFETYQKLQPLTGESQKLQPAVAELYPKKLQTASAESDTEKLQTLSGELLFRIGWSNQVTILDRTQSMEEKKFYIKMCIKEQWSNRELKRQIDSSLFERYMLADRPENVTALIPARDSTDLVRHFKDEYVLEFLDLKKEYSEQELEKAILDNLRDFFLEFGKVFSFVGSQYIIDIGRRENKIDLLFFHRELRCLVAVELKIGEFKAAYVGQMQKYLAALDEKVRLPEENESIGLILCKSKNHEEVRFTLAKTLSPIKVALYKTKLPDKKLIMKRLAQFSIQYVRERN
jgi:predicted nuclease of restriction endonuclease-like (RecB) superfamily